MKNAARFLLFVLLPFALIADDDALSAVAAAVLEGRTEEALVLFAKLNPETLPATEEDLEALRKDLSCLSLVPTLVLHSFQQDVGSFLDITFRDGVRRIKIESVSGGQVEALRRADPGTEATTESFRFGVVDLGPAEIYRRLAERKQEGFHIARALLVHQAGKSDLARDELGNIRGLLAAALYEALGGGGESGERSVEEEKWLSLLERVGLREQAGNPDALAFAIREGLEGRQQRFLHAIPDARKLLEEHGESDYVGERSYLLSLFLNPAGSRATFKVSVPATSVNVAKALANLALENHLGDELNFSFSRRKGQRRLNLSQNPRLESLKALRGLELLQINLSGTGMEHVEDLAGMPIVELDLNGTEVRSLIPLRNGKLRSLKTGPLVGGLIGLEGNPLETLWVQSQHVGDLQALRGMPLKFLDLSASDVSDLGPLAGLPLETLIVGSEVRDLGALADCPLKHLDLRRSAVRDLRPLRDMDLNVFHAGPEIHDLRVLEGMPLRELTLEASPVADLRVLEGMPLQTLRIRKGMKIRSLAVLEDMPLQEAYLDTPEVRDLRALASCKRLRVLDLSTVVVPDLSVLLTCRNLTHLAIHPQSGNKEALKDLHRLQFIEMPLEGGWRQRAGDFWEKRGKD